MASDIPNMCDIEEILFGVDFLLYILYDALFKGDSLVMYQALLSRRWVLNDV